jgi:hypothetical protein
MEYEKKEVDIKEKRGEVQEGEESPEPDSSSDYKEVYDDATIALMLRNTGG